METLLRYREDARYKNFSLWTHPTHQDIALEIIALGNTLHSGDSDNDEDIDDNRLNDLYLYICFETRFECYDCKERHHISYAGPADFAINPDKLFEGDTLVCDKCSKRKFDLTVPVRTLSYNSDSSNILKCEMKHSIPPYQVHIYNYLHDYVCLLSKAHFFRNSIYPVSVYDPYYNFREWTLFDMLYKARIKK